MQELLLFNDFALPSVAPACAGIAAGPRSPLNTAGWLSPSPQPAQGRVKLDSVICNDSLDIHLLHRHPPGPHDVGGQHSAGPALPRPAVDRCHAPPASHLLCRGVSVPGANVCPNIAIFL